MYITASSLFRLERRATERPVVDSTTPLGTHLPIIRPDEGLPAPAPQRAAGNNRGVQESRAATYPSDKCGTRDCGEGGDTRSDPEDNPSRTAVRILAFAIERGDRLHDILKLFVGQFRIDGQREHFFGGTFRLRERAFLTTQITITILQMQRQRVIDL